MDETKKNDIEGLLNVLHDPLAVSLRARWNAFNPFRVLRAAKRELRHTATLAWLLDPRENHGLGDLFLRGFLKSVCDTAGDHAVLLGYETDDDAVVRVHPELPMDDVDDLDSIVFDGKPEPVDEESEKSSKRRVDVLVEGNGWAVAIEAKIHATEGKDQLAAYRAKLSPWARDTKRALLLIYLTIDEQDEDREGWANAVWSDAVAQPLRTVLAASGETAQLGDHQHAFLTSYLDILSDIADDADGPVNRHLAELANTHTAALKRLQALKSTRRNVDPEAPAWAVLYKRNETLFNRLLTYVDPLVTTQAAAVSRVVTSRGFVQVRSDNSYQRFIPGGWKERFPWIFEPADSKLPRVLYEIAIDKNGPVSLRLSMFHLDSDKYANETYRARRVALLEAIKSDPANAAVFNNAFDVNGRPVRKKSKKIATVARRGMTWNAADESGSCKLFEQELNDLVSTTLGPFEALLMRFTDPSQAANHEA